MTEYGKSICPECGAANGLGAPDCAACGLTLMRPGMSARPVDDEEEDEAPRKPVKKPAPRPADEAVQKGPPPKKKPAPQPDEDEEDDEPRRPAKKKVSRRDDDDEADEEPASIRDNTLLNMLFPVGVSIWAMLANYFGGGGLILIALGFLMASGMGFKLAGAILPGLGGFLCLLAIPLGGMSFILRPKKTTYGGVTGYMRAIIGIGCGLAGIIAAPLAYWFLSTL